MTQGSRKRRTWIGGLAILAVLAATAVPVLASSSPTKIYDVTVQPQNGSQDSVATQGSGSTGNCLAAPNSSSCNFTVQFRNATPDGKSSFNSLEFNTPRHPDGDTSISTPFTVTAASLAAKGTGATDSTNANNSAIVSWGTGCVKGASATGSCQTVSDPTVVVVTGLDPVQSKSTNKPAQWVTVNVTVTTPALASACSGRFSRWADLNDPYTAVWTGTNTSGNQFAQNEALGTTTVVSKTCAPSIQLSKTNPIQDEAITATVTYPDNAYSGLISLAFTTKPTSSSPSQDAQSKNANLGVASFTISGDLTGLYGVTATVGTASSAEATFTVYEGTLNCGDQTSADNGVKAYRAPNKDGSTCILVPYTFNTDFTKNPAEVSFVWDEILQGSAQFRFVIPWPASSRDNPSYASDAVTRYQVGSDPYRDLKFCDGMGPTQTFTPPSAPSVEVSQALGQLGAAVAAGDGTLSVTGATGPPQVPFDAFIGKASGAEWIRVIAVNAAGTSWTVLRGYGGTTAAAAAASTTIYLGLPSYPSGEKACLSNTTTVGVAGTTNTQTTEEIWTKGDASYIKPR